MRTPGGWRGSAAVIVLVAAGLSVSTAGAAAADEPGDARGPLIVTCENGELVAREPTEEERERLRTVPAPPERPHVGGRHRRVEPDDGRVLPDGGAVRVVPAEPAAPVPVTCDADGPRAPRVERAEPVVPAPPR